MSIAILLLSLLSVGITIPLFYKKGAKKMIKTSNHKWLRTAIRFYKEKKEFNFVDDASLGIEKIDLESGISLIKKAEQTGIPSLISNFTNLFYLRDK